MDTEYGFVPLPEEGTDAFRYFEMSEECSVMVCRGEAPDPYAAAAAYSGEPWCPGHCARFVALTLGALLGRDG